MITPNDRRGTAVVAIRAVSLAILTAVALAGPASGSIRAAQISAAIPAARRAKCLEQANCRNALAQASTAPATVEPYLIDRMGLPISVAAARHQIMFRPFAPPRRIIATVLLPPFHGDDVRRNRGIGFEYTAEFQRRYALAEWPANGGSIAAFEHGEFKSSTCPSARIFPRGTSPNGIVWSTPHGLIMTLQLDGHADAKTFTAEWLKLVRRGACR